VTSTATTEGPEWSARARAWADTWGEVAAPAREAVAAATGIGDGTRVLDVGCGSGEFCLAAAARGAIVSGIDAAEGMIAIARERLPNADLRVGPMEHLPWDDGAFDVVTGFNAFQFAADMVGALREAGRVARAGGAVAICNWSHPQERDLTAVFGRLRELEPPAAHAAPPPAAPPPDASAAPPPVRDPGVLEDLARRAGLAPGRAHEVDVPYRALDLWTLERAVLEGAGFGSVLAHASASEVRQAIADAAAPFRQPDGSYLFRNRFRYVIARVPS
jgi:SAM-dependent methyltransferase